jgi:very-short-patch-repair endonuclease
MNRWSLCYYYRMVIHINNLNQLLIARRDLRNNATLEEDALWQKLRSSKLGFKFRRQHSIKNFIVDFYCPIKKLAVELDGEQHLDNKEYDRERNDFLESLEIRTIRFWNSEVNKDIEIVVEKIRKELTN